MVLEAMLVLASMKARPGSQVYITLLLSSLKDGGVSVLVTLGQVKVGHSPTGQIK